MINAEKELKNVLKQIDEKIICGKITFNGKHINLRLDYTEELLDDFFKELNFDYDNTDLENKLEGSLILTNQKWIEIKTFGNVRYWSYKFNPYIYK